MNKIIHLGSTIKAKEEENGVLKITGYASTSAEDRVGDIILPDAWNKGGLENFKKNPIILFNHNYDKPIGKATSVSVTDKGLSIEAVISKAAGEVIDLIKDGVLSTFSVGFRIKDADYNKATDGLIIKDAELFETSVVSVPCNQDATFSLSKSFDSEEEYRDYLKQFVTEEEIPAEQPAEDSVNAQDSAGQEKATQIEPIKKEIEMDEKQLQAMLKQVAEDTAKALAEETAKKAKEEADAKAAKDAEDEAFNIKVTTAAEKLVADVEDRFRNKNEDLEKIVGELKEELSSKSEEIQRIHESKRIFADRSGQSADWKKAHGEAITDLYFLGLATKKGWDTKAGKEIIEKVNADSGVAVSSEDFEQIVSTNIERDIQNELILAPMFRELAMNSATMILPILPDAGYAEFVSATTTAASAPKGNLDQRSAAYGDNAGVALGERTVSTKKLMSVSYLGNETEEDAILPILPLIRESMVRSHARAVENAILVGNHADGAFGTAGASFDGLVKMADDDAHQTAMSVAALASQNLTAAQLFTLRKNMGKYGLRPSDIVYIVSQRGYFELIEDAEFQDANLVGEDMATKIKGSIGKVFGSPVVVCDEFADAAVGAFNAIAVNTRNYLVPRLRGMTFETEYQAVEQRRALVSSQRLGFVDVIEGAPSVWGLQYGAEA